MSPLCKTGYLMLVVLGYFAVTAIFIHGWDMFRRFVEKLICKVFHPRSGVRWFHGTKTHYYYKCVKCGCAYTRSIQKDLTYE